MAFGSYSCPMPTTFLGGAVSPPWWKDLRYEDMNISNGGVARDTTIGATFTNIYSKTGSGFLIAFLITVEDPGNTFFKLIVDGSTIFELSMEDMDDGNLYDYKDRNTYFHVGLGQTDKTFRWRGPMLVPVPYNASIDIQMRTTANKKFRAGLVSRTI